MTILDHCGMGQIFGSTGNSSDTIDEFVGEIVSTLKEYQFDCVVFDLRLLEVQYPINSVNPVFLNFVLRASQGICESGFSGDLVHINYARNLGNFMSNPLAPGKEPTGSSKTVENRFLNFFVIKRNKKSFFNQK